MCKNLIEGSLLVLALILVCGCLMTNTKTYTFRLLLSAVIVMVLLVVNQQYRKERFTDSLTSVDSDVLINGDTRLQREQDQTSRELDVLEGQIRLMKKIYLNNISENRRANTPTMELRCSPPTAHFDEEDVLQVPPVYEGLNINDLSITADQLTNLINECNTLTS